MKKLALLTFNFFLFFYCLKAQTYLPFPDDSIQWSVWYNNSPSITSFQYKLKGDTLINGLGYHKIYKSFDLNYASHDTLLNCFIRQDILHKKVYARYPYSSFQDSSEFVLYDFNLTVGDTFMLKILPNHISYPSIVTADMSIQYNFDLRRGLFLNVIDTCQVSWCLWGIGMEQLLFTEGTGGFNHPFYCELPVNCCVNTDYNVECVWENGQYVFGGTFCDYNTGIENLDLRNNNCISALPNPASSSLNILISNPAIKSLQVFNSMGKLITIIPVEQSKIILDLSDIPIGLFLIRGFSEKFICTSRFIKTK